MEKHPPSLRGQEKTPQVGGSKRRRLKEFLRVEEIGSHIDRVTGTLDNIVFRGMEESEREIRRKRFYLSIFAFVLLITLGAVLSKKSQAEVAIFNPSSCLGGWNNVSNATGKQDTSDGTPFSNINSAILPEGVTADLFCGEFKGEIPEDSEPKLLMLRIAWSIEGATSTEIIQGENFASSTQEILDAPASTSPDFILINVESASTTQQEEVSTSSTETPAQVEVVPVILDAPIDAPTEPQPVLIPESETTTPPTETSTTTQSTGDTNRWFAFFKRFFEKAYAQETEVVTEPVVETVIPVVETVVEPTVVPTVLEAPIDTPIVVPEEATNTPTVLETPIDTPPPAQEETVTQTSVLEAPINDVPVGETVGATSTEVGTSTDVVTATSTENASSTEIIISPETDQSVFEVLYSLDGTTWNFLGSVSLEQLHATQFQIPLPEESSWGELSKLQIHIKRRAGVDAVPTIFLDAVTLEVEVLRIPHVEPTHPDFERDVIVRDVTENGLRIVTIVNADTQQEETWYMYLDEEVVATSTLSSATTTIDIATTTEATSTDIVVGTTTDEKASSTDSATSTEIRLPQMKERNIWKKYVGENALPSFEDIVVQERIPSLAEVASSTKNVIKEVLVLDLLPDLAADRIRRIRGVFLNSIIVQVIGNTKDELWLYDAENETKEKLGGSTTTATLSPEYPFGIKGGFIFWLSEDKGIVYAYNPTTKLFLEQPLPTFDPSLGERAELFFPEIPWKVIVSGDEFTFYSNETGEVFSDDDGTVREALRKKFNLDTVLNADKLNQLDFSVEQTEAEEQ